MAKPSDKSFFNPNKELTEAIVALHKWLVANLSAATKHDLKAELNKTEVRILKPILEIKNGIGQIMATQAEVAAELRAAMATIEKIGTETDKLIQTVKDLEAAVGNQTGASPELLEALADVKTQLGILDDKVPDGSGDGGQT